MSKISLLDKNITNEISKYITEKSSNISKMKNDDIFELLERYCTVVYYPLPENENNDGFHVKRLINGREENFVFINTQKYNEKQIFTAAHELGHILELDKHLIKQGIISPDDIELQEASMNQFAAQILMPEMQFKMSLWNFQNGRTEFLEKNFIEIVVSLMHEFFVPFKAVLWRLCELSLIDIKLGNDLLEKYKESIPDLLKQNNYKKLGKRNRKKSIRGFKQLLDEVEQLDCLPESKISNIRKEFSLKETSYEQNQKFKITGADI